MISYTVLQLNDCIEVFGEQCVKDALRNFSCSDDRDLESFLTDRAIKYEESAKGKTFLVLDDELYYKTKQLVVIAYYTLANTSIELSNFSDSRKKKVVGDFPNRTKRNSFPAFLIGQLGRDDRYNHDALSGETLLNEAYHTLAAASTVLGGKLVVLECRSHMFEKVYEPLGFKKLVNELSDEGLYMLYNRIDFSSYKDERET